MIKIIKEAFDIRFYNVSGHTILKFKVKVAYWASGAKFWSISRGAFQEVMLVNVFQKHRDGTLSILFSNVGIPNGLSLPFSFGIYFRLISFT
jgi:hypothetical protein